MLDAPNKEAIEKHHDFMRSSGTLVEKERQRCHRELMTNLREQMNQKIEREVSKENIEAAVLRIHKREIDPGTAAKELLSPVLGDL